MTFNESPYRYDSVFPFKMTDETSYIDSGGDETTSKNIFTLTILNSAMNPNRYIRFKDCFPTSISDVPFDTTLSDVDYIETTATFKFRMFDIETTG